MGINPILALQAALGVLTALFVAGWTAAVVAVRRGPAAPSPATEAGVPTLIEIGIGAVTNFFDTLGIGSFATTTALFRVPSPGPGSRHPGHAECRPHAADGRAGVHLHDGDSGRCADARQR